MLLWIAKQQCGAVVIGCARVCSRVFRLRQTKTIKMSFVELVKMSYHGLRINKEKRLFEHLTPDCRPVAPMSRNYSPSDRAFIATQTGQMLRDGIIRWFLTFFTYLTLSSNNIARFTPSTLHGADLFKIRNNKFLQFRIICKIYIFCNWWFSKFIPLEDELYPQG